MLERLLLADLLWLRFADPQLWELRSNLALPVGHLAYLTHLLQCRIERGQLVGLKAQLLLKLLAGFQTDKSNHDMTWLSHSSKSLFGPLFLSQVI